jgi:hypothetical protein
MEAQLTALIAANPALTAAGVTVQYVVNPNTNQGHFFWDANVGSTTQFVFAPDDVSDEQNLACMKCLITLGAAEDAVEIQQTHTFGIPPMIYTRWLDICSSRLTKFQRVKDATTMPQFKTADVIARIYAVPPNVSQNPAQAGQLFSEPWIMTIDYNTPKHIKWNPDEPISNFDVTVRDEFGDLMPWSSEYPTEYQLTILASET